MTVVELLSFLIDFTVEPPVILRPGRITREELENVIGCEVEMNTSLKASDKGVPKAPGMKYKHYAPRARMILVLGSPEKTAAKINELVCESQSLGYKAGVIATDESLEKYQADEVVSVGTRKDMETVMANLYDVLRGFDKKDIDIIYSEGFEGEPLEEAVMNRLVKAAGHEIIRV